MNNDCTFTFMKMLEINCTLLQKYLEKLNPIAALVDPGLD